ncbi:SMP-30/gluconolactonase/LRE family protein [Nocardia goodfellowii]|uniref:Gluconolactonase n=1 Tax=Nocardia goodfellowii TaxID=882446 RepID=A0ABS4QJ54_9NOCA|nr:SMP-30/gluconolactonase/LRE family protein [Nocardia goodfellowii]MBP2191742.1 gluconolactonase [Nocardia goodfellowii]
MTGQFGEIGPLRVEIIASGLGFVEGPAILPDGRIALASMSRGSVMILDPDGTVAAEHYLGGGPNGLVVGADGALYVAQNGGRFAARSRAAPGIQVIRDGHADYAYRGLESPNDLVFGPDGRLWVTDSRADVDFRRPESSPPGQVWAIDLDSGRAELMAQGPIFVNGIGFSPDCRTLYVTETVHAHVTAYPLRAGTLQPGRILATLLGAHPDGFAVDTAGRLWITTTTGDRIDVLAPDGTLLAQYPLPPNSMPTNICVLPGPEVFVTAAGTGSLLRLVPRSVAGLPTWLEVGEDDIIRVDLCPEGD